MVKKIIKYFLLPVIFIVLLAISLTYIYNDKIKLLIITELNKELSGELEVEGFEITLLSSLPNARAEFQQVQLKDKTGKVFLKAKVLGFDLSLFSLVGANPRINKVVIKDGVLDIIRFKNGKFNTDILNKKPKKETNSDFFKLSLNEATLINTRIHYLDKKDNIDAQLKVKDALFSGEFAKDKFIVYSDAHTTILSLIIEGKNLYKSLPFNYKTIVFADFGEGFFELSETEINLGVLDLIAEGKINKIRGGYDVDILMNSVKNNLSEVWSVMPVGFLNSMPAFNSTGEISISADINGTWLGNIRPEVIIELDMDKGSIEWPKLTEPLTDLSFNLKLHNLNKNFSISSNDILFKWNKENISASINVNDLSNPTVEVKLDGRLHLPNINNLLEENGLNFTNGIADLSDVIVKYEKDVLEFKSNVKLEEVDLLYNEKQIVIDSALLFVDQNDIKVEKAHFNNQLFQGELSGNINNATAAILKKEETINLYLYLGGETINIDDLLSVIFATSKDKEKNKEKKEDNKLLVTGNIEGSFKNFNYKNISANKTDLNLTLLKNDLEIEGDLDVFGGTVSLEGNLKYKPNLHFYSTIDCKNVEADTLFNSFNNFEQDVITSSNIKGKITSAIETNIYWDENGNIDKKKLNILAAIKIEDGELNGLKMLDDFANYIHVKDLHNLKFDVLQNWLQIKEGRIYLPKMFINSNALNMTVCGLHSFENNVQYYIKLNAARVLINRYVSNNSKQKFQPRKEDKFFNLFFSLEGPINKIRTKPSRKKVKRKLELFEGRKTKIKNQLIDAMGPLGFMDELNILVKPALEFEDDDDNEEYDENEEADEDYIIEGF